ncbi:hypothetical protein C8R44DRAFT_987021 [Mycena epipterygia]|nr:hypothetical protein C8R44DRAFT_987021 [Mycena epipterygia]
MRIPDAFPMLAEFWNEYRVDGAHGAAVDVPQAPSGLDADPTAYLALPRFYGAADGMVPARGRSGVGDMEGGGVEDARGGLGDGHVNVEGGTPGDAARDAPILGTGVWTEVPEAGHDDVLFLEEVVDAILGRVRLSMAFDGLGGGSVMRGAALVEAWSRGVCVRSWGA